MRLLTNGGESYPRCESPRKDLRPDRVGHWCTSSGELRRERQYRGDEASIGAELPRGSSEGESCGG